MLPAADLTQILTNLSAHNLQPNTAAQLLGRRARTAAAVGTGEHMFDVTWSVVLTPEES